MQKTTCSLHLAKEMEVGRWGGGGECDNKGRKTRGRERDEGDEGITQLKTNVISAAAERKQCLLLGEACLTACSS